MASWLEIAAADGPPGVEKAREAAQTLADRLVEDRQAEQTAKAALIECKRSKRETFAAQMREGRDDPPDETDVDQASAAVAGLEHKVAARELALADSQRAFGEEIQAARGEWMRLVDQRARRARRGARKTVARLKGELGELVSAEATRRWLETGLDSGRRVKLAGLDGPPSSAHAMANGSPVGVAQLIAWLVEVIEPEPQEAEPEGSTVAAGE